jgi:hypothetical protein
VIRGGYDYVMALAGTTWREGEVVVVQTGLQYRPGEEVEIEVRKRGWRFDISDRGRAVAAADSPAGWQQVAERVVDAHALNVNRRGVVFVQSNEPRRESLARRVAECSVALYQELLENGS